MGGAAPIVDAVGHVWVATGNGFEHVGLLPRLQRLCYRAVVEPCIPIQFFAPSTWAVDNRNDYDLGSRHRPFSPLGWSFRWASPRRPIS